MKVSRFPCRQESEGAGAQAGRRRAPRTAWLALLAALVLFLLAGVVRISALGGPATAPKRAPAFKYSYRVLEVQLYGVFTTNSTMGRRGEDLTFTGKEEIWVFGLLKSEKTQGDLLTDLFDADDPTPLVKSKTFAKGTLTLQSPASEIIVNGMLQTSDFKRDFIIKGAGIESGGQNFSCGETLDDVGSFVGVMRLSGSEKVKVFWILPAVSYNCGPVTVDYNDQHRLRRIEGDPSISTADDPNQEAQTYPLSVFRQKRFMLNIDIAHSWEPDYATKANVVWKGKVWLERIESGKGKK